MNWNKGWNFEIQRDVLVVLSALFHQQDKHCFNIDDSDEALETFRVKFIK
nr:290_t:CDS:2 [Entrophospora candida]